MCGDEGQIFVWEGPELLPRPTHGTSRAVTHHRLLTNNFTVSDKFWEPGVPCVKFLSNILSLEAPGSCPGFLSQAPRALPDGAISISTLSRLRMLRQGPGSVPAAEFMVDHASRKSTLFLRDFSEAV